MHIPVAQRTLQKTSTLHFTIVASQNRKLGTTYIAVIIESGDPPKKGSPSSL